MACLAARAQRGRALTVLVVTGVSGSGKSTVARAVADALGWPVADADDLHPAANVAKMAAGHPLTGADRAPWLLAVRAWIDAHPERGVISCSALQRAYRDVLRSPAAAFVLLDGPRDVLHARLSARTGHFMPASLLDSQLALLERPGRDETALTVPIEWPLHQQVQAIVAWVGGGLDAGVSAGGDHPVPAS